MDKSLTKQIVELNNKSLEDLRAMHEQLFSEKPRLNSNRYHLITKLGYRLQELTLGGLSEASEKELEKLASNKSVKPTKSHTDLLPGTKLCREWNGMLHEVEITKTCFEYQGQPFKSLSAIARKITGTQWNGKRFFKLRTGASA